MKNPWKFVRLVVTIGVILFFITYFLKNKNDLLNVLSVPFEYLVIMVSLNFIGLFFNGLVLRLILKSFDRIISIPETYYLSTISALGNFYLPMKGGTVGQSIYLKKKFKFPYPVFVSMLYGTYIITYIFSSFTAILVLFIIQKKTGEVFLPLYAFFGLLFLAMCFLTIVKFPKNLRINKKFKLINKVFTILKEILNGWEEIVKNKKLLLSLFSITIASFFVIITIIYFQYKSLGIDTNISNLILYNSISGVSQIISITPSSLGIREGLLILTSETLGITNDQIMQLGLLDRGVFLLSLLLSYFFYIICRWLWNFTKKKKSNTCN